MIRHLGTKTFIMTFVMTFTSLTITPSISRAEKRSDQKGPKTVQIVGGSALGVATIELIKRNGVRQAAQEIEHIQLNTPSRVYFFSETPRVMTNIEFTRALGGLEAGLYHLEYETTAQGRIGRIKDILEQLKGVEPGGYDRYDRHLINQDAGEEAQTRIRASLESELKELEKLPKDQLVKIKEITDHRTTSILFRDRSIKYTRMSLLNGYQSEMLAGSAVDHHIPSRVANPERIAGELRSEKYHHGPRIAEQTFERKARITRVTTAAQAFLVLAAGATVVSVWSSDEPATAATVYQTEVQSEHPRE